MISKNDIKLIRSLAIKKFRGKLGLFVVEGEKIVAEMLRDGSGQRAWNIRSVYYTEEWELPDTTDIRTSPMIQKISVTELKQCSFLSTPNKVLAVVEIPETVLDPSKLAGKLTLVLDAVRDPGNLGTIIRIAHWFGVKNIICSGDTVDLYNPKTIQATMGSFLAVQVHYMNLHDFLGRIKGETGIPVYGCYMEGERVFSLEPEQEACIVLGNESTGIDSSLEPLIHKKITIPSFSGSGNPDSLNVAVSAGIILSAFRRNSDRIIQNENKA